LIQDIKEFSHFDNLKLSLLNSKQSLKALLESIDSFPSGAVSPNVILELSTTLMGLVSMEEQLREIEKGE